MQATVGSCHPTRCCHFPSYSLCPRMRRSRRPRLYISTTGVRDAEPDLMSQDIERASRAPIMLANRHHRHRNENGLRHCGIWRRKRFGFVADGSTGHRGFFAAFLLIRLSGRRSFGQRSPFDYVVAILLGATLSRVIVGASPAIAMLVASLALVILHRLVAWACVRWKNLERLLVGTERELYRDGASTSSR
jgi:hypothetical protein